MVRHEPEEYRFVLNQDGIDEEAVLKYELTQRGPDTVFDFVHTQVPEAMRNLGMAAALVRTACEYARSNNIKVIATCSYVLSYMAKTTADQDVLYTE